MPEDTNAAAPSDDIPLGTISHTSVLTNAYSPSIPIGLFAKRAAILSPTLNLHFSLVLSSGIATTIPHTSPPGVYGNDSGPIVHDTRCYLLQ